MPCVHRDRLTRMLKSSVVAPLALLMLAPSAGAQTAQEIIDRVDRLMHGNSSHGRVTMEITTEHWSRSLEMEVWSLGTEHSRSSSRRTIPV